MLIANIAFSTLVRADFMGNWTEAMEEEDDDDEKKKVFGNKVNDRSEFSLVLQCSLKIVKCVRVALHSSIELCAREPIEAVNFQ